MKNYTITVNGVAYNVTVEENTSGAPAVQVPAAPAPQAKQEAPATSSAEGSVKIEAPMPGNILDIKVSEGQKVASGETVIVLEAMKMENDIVAPKDGVIASINVNKGDTVEAGKLLITLG